MPLIHLTTFIASPAEVVFDLSRHVGLHKEAMSEYREDAVAGTRMGLIEKGDTVTWKARHLFKERLLRVKITDMERPLFFKDEQLEGDFKAMRHEHHFKPCDNGTIVINLFHFETPYGLLGQGMNRLYLTRYLRHLLEKHNRHIQSVAESGRWKRLLSR